MHDNAFGPIGVAQFESFLKSASSLQVLSVTNCGLGPVASTTIAQALISNDQIKLRELRMSRSRVETEGAKALAAYFETYDGLEHLELSQNGIRDEGSAQLGRSLMQHATSGNLTYLDIGDNYFSEEEPKQVLFDLIKSATALVHLNIDSNNLDEEEMGRELMVAVEESESKSTLKYFSWSYDAFEFDKLIKDMLDLLGNEALFPELEHIELVETLESKPKRNSLRKDFKAKGIELVLSDR